MFEIFDCFTGETFGRVPCAILAAAECLRLAGLDEMPLDGFCGFDFVEV